jgi:ABC-type multidrug transport system permease subunit
MVDKLIALSSYVAVSGSMGSTMQIGQIPYVIVTTVLTIGLTLIYPIVSGNWRFAYLTVPLFAAVAILISRNVLKNHGLPFGATFDHMREAAKKKGQAND